MRFSKQLDRNAGTGIGWKAHLTAACAAATGDHHSESAKAMEFTAVYIEVPEGYVAFVAELLGANTQGATLDEARENLREAVELVLEANRELAEQSRAGQSVTRERLTL